MLTGAGRAFCSGLELEHAGMPPGTEDLGRHRMGMRAMEYMGGIVPAMRAIPQPVIAAIKGPAYGGGMCLSLGADIRLAGRVGRLLRSRDQQRAGRDRTRGQLAAAPGRGHVPSAEILLTGKKVDADEALRMGLVSRVVADDGLLDRGPGDGGGHVRLQPVRTGPDQGHHVGVPGGGEPPGRRRPGEPHPAAGRPHRKPDRGHGGLQGEAPARLHRVAGRTTPDGEPWPKPVEAGNGPATVRPGRRAGSGREHWRADGQPKTRFADQDDANRSALRLRLEQGADLDPYRCRLLRGMAPGQPAVLGRIPPGDGPRSPVQLYRPDGIVDPWIRTPPSRRATPSPGPDGQASHQGPDHRRGRGGRAARRRGPTHPGRGRGRGRPVSKGGVLYHFPTRDALVAGMVAKIIDEFDRDIERRLLEDDGGPGQLHPGLHPGHHGPGRAPPDREDRLGAAVIAAAAAQPALLVPLQEAADRWQARLERRRARSRPWPPCSAWPATACGCATCSAWPRPTAGPRAAVGEAARTDGRRRVMTTARPATVHRPGAAAQATDESRRLIRTLTLTVFLQWMGATAIIPMLPVYIRHLGGTDALAGVVMASFFAAGVLSQYPIGRLADRIGRRPVLIAGLITYGLASFSFLLPITATVAIVLRVPAGGGGGAATVAALAMMSSSVAAKRRGRAFASIYGGELAGMAIGPLVGSIVGIRYMWVMFLASGAAVHRPPACRPSASTRVGAPRPRAARTRRPTVTAPRWPACRVNRAMTGALICGAALGLTSGVYDICWTLLLLARGASGLAIGISWTLFAVPFVAVAKPRGGWPTTWTVGYWCWPASAPPPCCAPPTPSSTMSPLLVILGASEALGFAAAMPAVQSLLTQGAATSEVGRIQGIFATSQTACTAVAAAAAGAAFALASWLPFVTVAAIVFVGLGAAGVVWRSVPGRVRLPPQGRGGAGHPSGGHGRTGDRGGLRGGGVRRGALEPDRSGDRPGQSDEPEPVGVSVDVQ